MQKTPSVRGPRHHEPMAPDLWITRDLPVLDAIVTALDAVPPGQLIGLDTVAERTGLSDDDVAKACIRLEFDFIELIRVMGPSENWGVKAVSASALRATGAWPTAESLAQEILDGLAREAETETDPQRASRLRTAVSALGEGARDLGVSVLASIIARQTGLG